MKKKNVFKFHRKLTDTYFVSSFFFLHFISQNVLSFGHFFLCFFKTGIIKKEFLLRKFANEVIQLKEMLVGVTQITRFTIHYQLHRRHFIVSNENDDKMSGVGWSWEQFGNFWVFFHKKIVHLSQCMGLSATFFVWALNCIKTTESNFPAGPH